MEFVISILVNLVSAAVWAWAYNWIIWILRSRSRWRRFLSSTAIIITFVALSFPIWWVILRSGRQPLPQLLLILLASAPLLVATVSLLILVWPLYHLGIIDDVSAHIESKNMPDTINEITLKLLRGAKKNVLTEDLLMKAAEAIRKQIEDHTAAIDPHLILGINPTGQRVASYLDGCITPRSNRPIGCIKTSRRIDNRMLRTLHENLPTKKELTSSIPDKDKVIGSILVVDSEYKRGSSMRQITRRLSEVYGIQDPQIFHAVLCVCGINIDGAWRSKDVTIGEILEKSKYAPRKHSVKEQVDEPGSFALFQCPDFVAFIARGEIEPASHAT